MEHAFVNHAAQFQWALDHLPLTSDWVMRLDADEVVSDELVAEICARLSHLSCDIAGVNLKRRHIVLGRWIRFGGRYPVILLRIWRRGMARIEARWMDEHMVLLQGNIIKFDHDFSDDNLNDLTFFTAKHNGYATREAIDILLERHRLCAPLHGLNSKTASRQAALKRWIKERLYNHLPFWLGPLAYFFYRYIILLGFLDGREGLIYHFLQGFWYRFLVGAKVFEFERGLKLLTTREERLEALARLSGYDIKHFTQGSSLRD